MGIRFMRRRGGVTVIATQLLTYLLSFQHMRTPAQVVLVAIACYLKTATNATGCATH